MNKKKIHWLWTDEGPQRRVHHPRKSSLNMVERSITSERLITQLKNAFAATGGSPKVLRLDNGPEMISQALQRFCHGKSRAHLYPTGHAPWNNGYIESFNGRMRRECLNRNHWTSVLEARVVIGDYKREHNQRHRHSALGYLTPAEYAAPCRHTHHPAAIQSTHAEAICQS